MSNSNSSPLAKLVPVPLTPIQVARRESLEAIVVDGISNFVKVGNALLVIQEERLYRSTHDSFASYMLEMFNISRPQGYRLMGAAQAVKNISGVSKLETLPISESVVRPLTGLEPEQQREVWTQAVAQSGDGKPTTQILTEIIKGKPNPNAKLLSSMGALTRQLSHLNKEHEIDADVLDGLRALSAELIKLIHSKDNHARGSVNSFDPERDS